jgi:hypothetical protein
MVQAYSREQQSAIRRSAGLKRTQRARHWEATIDPIVPDDNTLQQEGVGDQTEFGRSNNQKKKQEFYVTPKVLKLPGC